MPKVKDKSLPESWIKNYPELTIENGRIFCRICSKTISIEKKFGVLQHVKTLSHQENKCKKKQLTIREACVTSDIALGQQEFSLDLCQALVAANIPWKKLENPILKEFLEKYCRRNIPSESTIRKNYLHVIYDKVFQSIKDKIGDNYVWFTVDETTDVCGRYIANLLIGILSEDSPTTAYLIASKELTKTNHLTIARFVQEGLSNFFLPNCVPNEKILLMLTDAAPYMVKASTSLKIFYENLTHCTCLAHGLSRVAETIRLQFPEVNDLIKYGKQIFVKAPLRVQAFKDHFPNVALPPEPILTRWGTWIDAALYYAEHFVEFKSFINDLSESSAMSVKSCQDVLENELLPQKLAYIKANYSCVGTTITNLETKNLLLVEALQIVEQFKNNVEAVQGNIGVIVKNKLKDVLKKNDGFCVLSKIGQVLNGESFEEPNNIKVPISLFKYAPITSVDVERSFSIYKNILSDRRQRFTLENLEKYIIINCFNQSSV